MSIFSREELYKLNTYMIDGGAPVEKDYRGYNKPDYIIMQGLGKKAIDELSDEELYNICLCLNHYQNTQLSDCKDRLQETKAYYKKNAKKEIVAALVQKVSYLYQIEKERQRKETEEHWKLIREKNKQQWQQQQAERYEQIRHSIKIIRSDAFSCQVSWEGVIPELKAFVSTTNGISWKKEESSNWTLVIDTRVLDKYIAFMQEHSYNTDILVKELIKVINTSEEDALKEFFTSTPLCIKGVIPNEFASVMNVYFSASERNLPGVVKDIIREYGIENNIIVKESSHCIYYETVREKADLLSKLFESFSFDYVVDKNLLEEMQVQYGRRSSNIPLIDISKLNLPFKPYPFQIEDAKIMLARKKVLLCSEMGAGKTLVAVLVGESIPKKKLVVCPETLRINWKREILQVNPDATVNVISKIKDAKFVDGWNIIGYSSISKLLQPIMNEKFEVCFFDEAHLTKSIKNNGAPTSQRGTAALTIAKNCGFCYPMTGTPIPTSNRDLYNLLSLIGHELTQSKWSFLEYGKKYCDGQHNGFGWDFTGNSNTDELYQVLTQNNTMIRHLKKDVLPHLKKQRIFMPVSIPTRKVVKEIETALQASGNANNFLAYSMTGRRILAQEKMKCSIEFAETILSQNKSIIIADMFNEPLDAVIEHFGKENVAVIRGGMTDEQKFAEVDAFQNGVKKVCALNIIAGGFGINLTRSNSIIFNSFDFTPGNLVQCEDRICRGNQTELCNVYYLYAEDVPLDEVFTKLLTEKFRIINESVDGGMGDGFNLVEEVFKALFTKKGTLRKKYQSRE